MEDKVQDVIADFEGHQFTKDVYLLACLLAACVYIGRPSQLVSHCANELVVVDDLHFLVLDKKKIFKKAGLCCSCCAGSQ